MSQVLYRKWRPMSFDEVIGQDHVTRTLRNSLAHGRVGHAYLLSGPRGTGKTTTARLLAKGVNCLDEDLAKRPCNGCRMCQAVNEGRLLDLIEIDAASNTGVDDVRDLRDKIGFSPNEARYKVYIIDEVHMLSNAAFSALLKTLEEPPPHAIFVLATTEPQKIPATVVSRCQRFEFQRIPVSLIKERLERLLELEGAAAEPAALDLVSRQATGAQRDAESLLDQLLSSQSGTITLERAQQVLGTARTEAAQQLVEAWIVGDSAAGLEVIQRTVDAGADPQQFSRQVVARLRALMLLKVGGVVPTEFPKDSHQALKRQADSLSMTSLIEGVKRFSGAVTGSGVGWQPQLPLELAFVECVNAGKSRRQDAVSEPAGQYGTGEAPASSVAPAAPPRPAVAPQPAGPPSVASVRERWDMLLEAVQRRDPRIEVMLSLRSDPKLRSNGRVLDVKGQTVVLGFTYGLHREKIQSDEWRRVVEDALSEVMGTPLRIQCVDPQTYLPPPETPDTGPVTPAAQEVEPIEHEAESESESALLSDSEIEELRRFGVEDLRAEIVEVE